MRKRKRQLLSGVKKMERFFNTVSVASGIICGYFTWLFGGGDALIWALLALIVIDYITGVLKAIYKKMLSSEIGRKGIVKKIMILVVVAAANIVQRVINVNVPVREIVIMFFIANEAISVMENVAETGIKVPQKLRDILLQLRDGGDNND